MKNKGFTFIELLAVIVILGIIALITVPTILAIVNDSRIGSAENSAAGIHASAQNYYMNYLVTNQGNFPETTIYCDGTACGAGTPEAVTTELLNFNGTIPTSGTIMIDTAGVITYESSPNLIINGYDCNYGATTGSTGSWTCT